MCILLSVISNYYKTSKIQCHYKVRDDSGGIKLFKDKTKEMLLRVTEKISFENRQAFVHVIHLLVFLLFVQITML